MNRPEVCGLLFALCCVLVTAEKPFCAWYGECGINSDRDIPRTCVAENITAQPIHDAKAKAVLQKRCPHFIKDNGLSIY